MADQKLARLSKAGMQTNILYDRVYPWANLGIKRTPGKPDTCNSDRMAQAVFELSQAELNSTNFADAPGKLYRLKQKYRGSNTVPLIVLNAQLDMIDTARNSNRT
ncbi:MAG: hypothetical protein V4543_15740 [Bacteroidota bacterium]